MEIVLILACFALWDMTIFHGDPRPPSQNLGDHDPPAKRIDAYVCVCLSVCLHLLCSLSMSVCLPLSLCLSPSLSLSERENLTNQLSNKISLSVCLSVCLSVSLSRILCFNSFEELSCAVCFADSGWHGSLL